MGNRYFNSNHLARIVILIAALMLLTYNSAFAAINSRLVFVSNSHNTTTGRGTLTLDLEAISTQGNALIDVYRIAFQLDPIFLTLNPVDDYADEYFWFDFGPPAHVYSPSQSLNLTNGEVSLIYRYQDSPIYPGNSRKSIGSSSYQKIVRVFIEYDLVIGMGSISWGIGYSVTNQSGTSITGVLEPIPPELTDISLPVELSSFNAVAGNDKVVLTWTTQSEINNQGFEVYRSNREDGAYALIASYENNTALQGAGNSNSERTYRYEDQLTTGGESYWYQIADVDYSGVRTFHGPVEAASPEVTADRFVLYPNFPNPFNPETNIRFEVPANSAGSTVKLMVYNNLGMEVRTLVNGSVEPGIHSLKWDGRNNSGELMASGPYFLRFETGNTAQIQKMLLVR